MPKDARGFSVHETQHAAVIAEPGLSDDSVRAVGSLFEIGYQVVGEDLGYPEKRPRLYVYTSEPLMYQDLTTMWGEPQWLKTFHTVPRMHRDYVEWIPPENHRDIAFITHEYSHRIIEQIAGLNSQISYKWFDEGLAQYEGQRALTIHSPEDAASQIRHRTTLIVQAYTSGSLTSLKDITTEWQWEKQIKNGDS